MECDRAGRETGPRFFDDSAGRHRRSSFSSTAASGAGTRRSSGQARWLSKWPSGFEAVRPGGLKKNRIICDS